MKLPNPSSAESIVSVANLSRRFSSKTVLDDLSLYVPKGCVFGLVGENGAGKTTLIKHILGILRAETGTVRVFGLDPVGCPVRVLERIGYLSEQPDLPGWMRVDELIRYTQAFYPNWDADYAEQMRRQFGLNSSARIKTLSKGQCAKAGLLIAQAHRPDLLLLDEPSSGLDPVVRKDILEAVIRTVADEGRTVFFSSHLLEEIERVSDYIAMIQRGRLVLFGSLDDIKAQYRRITLRFESPQAASPAIPGALSIDGLGREWSVVCKGGRAEISEIAAGLGASIVEEAPLSLDEIFVAHAGASSDEKPVFA
ncbi:MAG TPA: ABC transporter ATP-binding protein [Verrucomicrobiae bacterium]|nr:ABC transporter ATP-binding protein [Verrucomicrobiae bacterium]